MLMLFNLYQSIDLSIYQFINLSTHLALPGSVVELEVDGEDGEGAVPRALAPAHLVLAREHAHRLKKAISNFCEILRSINLSYV